MRYLITLLCSLVLLAVTASAQSPRAGQIVVNAGAPVAGTDEVQTITIGGTPTAGTFRLTFWGQTTAAITWSATDATLVSNIDAALEALTNIGTGGVVVADASLTDGIGAASVTFSGTRVSKRNQPQMTVTSALTGTSPTIAVTTTTPGVNATHLGAEPGVLLVDTTNKDLYLMDGTATAPTWEKLSD